MKPSFANELERTLTGDSFAAPPSHILEGIDDALAHRELPHVPRSIYAELWHITFWQQLSLDWVRGIPTPNPASAAAGFFSQADIERENWSELRVRFARTSAEAAENGRDAAAFERVIRCPSPPGHPERTMTVREQLENLTAHNAYHFGRIVLMRQMAGSWPPPSGGFSW
ncbi:MAG TPA: DinB family protein [Acidobacteriaceae bacterium]